MPETKQIIDRRTRSIGDWRKVTANVSMVERNILQTGSRMSYQDRLWIVDAFKDRPNRVGHIIPDESVQFLFTFYELPDIVYHQAVASLQPEKQTQLPTRRQSKVKPRRKPKRI